MNHKFTPYHQLIASLHAKDSIRSFRPQTALINLSSNDYLGLINDQALKDEFLHTYQHCTDFRFGSSSSRLLTGNFNAHEQLEATLSKAYKREVLIFNSGYHMNIGIMPALCDQQTLILADKWVHASMIDGIRLAKERGTKSYRYRHQDFCQLNALLDKHHAHYRHIIIMTESVFSMDGDVTDLTALAALKQAYPNVSLYVDEAHGVGAFGRYGLGVAEQMGVMNEIDFLVGTFGKAFASIGGFLVCDEVIKQVLINTMRPVIFSTNLPPINALWSDFIFQKSSSLHKKRQELLDNAKYFIQRLKELGYQCPSDSHIIPIIIGDNNQTVALADKFRSHGFYVLPIRPPTVPVGTSRLRVCLTADITRRQIDDFLHVLGSFQ
ncbi:8-amino-7-oxononanoate synthase [Moraxella haemolytica]|uniref:aminotransferase class I/II-fold pyridoxal phosphate-dependent enzyme n=1 Tax=Moraxella haemolytica TaxID=2904119 RepID=UPI002543E9BE|nr:8-amino-7-oxononanoate synthase [Moraxella sp. ZY171148]WII95096.1 8-amino-7-oxononanoate synthase [Moraxella sp. ZY171148]